MVKIPGQNIGPLRPSIGDELAGHKLFDFVRSNPQSLARNENVAQHTLDCLSRDEFRRVVHLKQLLAGQYFDSFVAHQQLLLILFGRREFHLVFVSDHVAHARLWINAGPLTV